MQSGMAPASAHNLATEESSVARMSLLAGMPDVKRSPLMAMLSFPE